MDHASKFFELARRGMAESDESLAKAHQVELFNTPTPIAGYQRGSRFVSPHVARRRHRMETPDRTHPAPAEPPKPALTGDALIQAAIAELRTRMRAPGAAIRNPDLVKDYMRLRIASLPHEAFHVLSLNNQHQVLALDEVSRGTINSATVHPREVVKAAMLANAAAVIFGHNHPSTNAEPSQADRGLTDLLKKLLAQIDVRVLDHIVVGGMNTVSFAERGWL